MQDEPKGIMLSEERTELAEGVRDAEGILIDNPEKLVQQLDVFLRETFGPPLKALHEPIDAWLGSLPMSVAMFCAIGLYAVAVIWVWTLPKEFVFRGALDRKPWRDLRVWATLVTVPYVLIYLWLGR